MAFMTWSAGLSGGRGGGAQTSLSSTTAGFGAAETGLGAAAAGCAATGGTGTPRRLQRRGSGCQGVVVREGFQSQDSGGPSFFSSGAATAFCANSEGMWRPPRLRAEDDGSAFVAERKRSFSDDANVTVFGWGSISRDAEEDAVQGEGTTGVAKTWTPRKSRGGLGRSYCRAEKAFCNATARRKPGSASPCDSTDFASARIARRAAGTSRRWSSSESDS
mmetsp:Transcript_10715/g.32212  ORF Transcript_10715/g.32212 Transcript_10715/m.32212 type:complete len:219 (+) Transcript_10715:475-1131(+)